MPYKIADGHDIALVSLADVDPQPKSEGIRCARRTHCADGTVLDEGRYVELEFSVLADVTEYQSVLSQFGVQSATTNEVTIYCRDETFAWVRMNGTAVRPEPGRDARWQYFPRNVVLLVRDLEAAS